eukprot:CFRG6248T1
MPKLRTHGYTALSDRNTIDGDGVDNDEITSTNFELDNEEDVLWRDVIGFWIFGLCNNYPYVIMLSAATYILEKEEHTSTGVILLADIIPALLVKVAAPFFMHLLPYHLKVGVVITSCFLSFIVVAYSYTIWLSVTGVCLASFSSGFGEITFLSLTHYFDKSTVSAWSSGTGMAGAAGALSYLALVLVLSPRVTLLIMCCVPGVMSITYIYVVYSMQRSQKAPFGSPLVPSESLSSAESNVGDDEEILINERIAEDVSFGSPGSFADMSLKQRLKLIWPLLEWMIPLFSVYYAEYSINQGLLEHVWWTTFSLSKQHQYVLFQAMYQVGVFISRSSVPWIRIERTWVLALLQVLNLVFLLLDNIFHIVPNVEIYCLCIFYEGLLGGAAYVNSFYSISTKVEPSYREFALGVTSVADTCGITFAAVSSIALNHWLSPIAHARNR